MRRHLVLVGGSAGSGKTSLARKLAGDLGAGWLQLDTVWIAMRTAARRDPSAFGLLDVAGRMHRGDGSDDELLAAQVAASHVVCEALPAVFAFELDARCVLVADGAWLLPSFVAGLELPDTEIHCVFLQHAGIDGVAAALAPRLGGRPAHQRHLRMNRQLWQYGAWLCEQARAHHQPVLDPMPFATLPDRARTALAI